MKVLKLLSKENVRLDLFTGVMGTSETVVELLAADPARALEVLRAADLPAEEVHVALAWLPDTPDCLAEACETLGAAGIHVHAAHVVAVDPSRGQHVVIESPDAERTDQLLWALRY